MKPTKLWLTAIAALLYSLTASADIDYDFSFHEKQGLLTGKHYDLKKYENTIKL